MGMSELCRHSDASMEFISSILHAIYDGILCACCVRMLNAEDPKFPTKCRTKSISVNKSFPNSSLNENKISEKVLHKFRVEK